MGDGLFYSVVNPMLAAYNQYFSAPIEQPTMAQMLARMERDGLIRREGDPNDRRSSVISLTKQARAKVPAGRAVLRQGNVEMTKGLTAREVETLLSLLRRVLANVEEMEQATQGAPPHAGRKAD